MSALAELLSRRGVDVQGTDASARHVGAPDLERLGIKVTPHDASLVRDARAVVYSSAIPATHAELEAARALGIPIIRRAEALGEIVNKGKVVGISGTHGKTTTTVMTTEALAAAGRDPTGIAGGRVASWEGNLRMGSDTYVVEADEYDRSFLALKPTVAVVLNVEADHLDIYRNLDDITRTFEQFVAPAQSIVRCSDDEGAMAIRFASRHRVISYSAKSENAHAAPSAAAAPSPSIDDETRLSASNIRFGTAGSSFDLTLDDEHVGSATLQVPGLHNIRNALAAIGSGIALDCRISDMLPGLASFRGVERRFERLGAVAGVEIVDDYAHHPTEIAATIAAARGLFPSRRLLALFQPHLYSRTRDLKAAFAESLSAADRVYLCDIYGAREEPIAGVDSSIISRLLPSQKLGWAGPRSDAAAALLNDVKQDDVVLVMGAGDVTVVGRELLTRMRHDLDDRGAQR